MGQRILLVEGPADSFFYAAFVRHLRIKGVKITPPAEYGAKINSKSNAIHVLPTLLDQLDDGSVSSIGLVVDADYEATGGLGFRKTLDQIVHKIQSHGFEINPIKQPHGFLFSHPDGLLPFGVWIMPNNKTEGMLEDFIKESIRADDQVRLRDSAVEVVASLKNPLFKEIHRSKAEVATWLAWQKTPGEKLESTIDGNLVDLTSPACSTFSEWLRTVFA